MKNFNIVVLYQFLGEGRGVIKKQYIEGIA